MIAHRLLGALILNTIESYRWSLVSSSLIDIKDENTVLENSNIQQLAIRKGRSIFIDRALWNLLDDKNKTALIFHEAIYALLIPKMDNGHLDQQSEIAREIVGMLFTEPTAAHMWFGQRKLINENIIYGEKMSDHTSRNYIIWDEARYVYATPFTTLINPVIRVSGRDKAERFKVNDDNNFSYSILQGFCEETPIGNEIIFRDEASAYTVELTEFQAKDGSRQYARATHSGHDLDKISYNLNYRKSYIIKSKESCYREIGLVLKEFNDILLARYELGWGPTEEQETKGEDSQNE